MHGKHADMYAYDELTAFYAYDELTAFYAFQSAKDISEKLKADSVIIERLQQRLAKKDLTTGGRMWISRGELRNLRRICGMNTSNATLRNRRIRVGTMKQWLQSAEDRLAERAGVLVGDQLVPELRPKVDFNKLEIRSYFNKALSAPYGVIKTDLP